MGFRYRKSINLGGGFRIKLSKSGIGYSWGVKGYRITKTAKGTIRRTASIPGTGISYVHETGKNNRGSSGYGTNPAFKQTVQSIDLDYSIDNDQQSIVDERMKPMIKITECAKVWRIMQTSKVIDRKYASGASNTVNRTACKATTNAPFPFKANLQVASFKAGKETLLFLPDKLFIMQGSKIGALNYSDIDSNTHTTRFIESESVPRDTQIVGQTWKYVNKSGGPDRRFKDNRQLPVCLYGKIELRSTSGLNTVIMFSNPNINN